MPNLHARLVSKIECHKLLMDSIIISAVMIHVLSSRTGTPPTDFHLRYDNTKAILTNVQHIYHILHGMCDDLGIKSIRYHLIPHLI